MAVSRGSRKSDLVKIAKSPAAEKRVRAGFLAHLPFIFPVLKMYKDRSSGDAAAVQEDLELTQPRGQKSRKIEEH